MANLLDMITSDEYYLLEAWRDWYAWGDEKADEGRIKPIREILLEWEKSNQDLYTLLGNSLMVTRNFEFCKPEDELRDEMFNMIDRRGCSYGRAEREGWKFTSAYVDWCDKTYPIHRRSYSWDDEQYELTKQQEEENAINIPIRNGLSELISVRTLVDNKYEGDDFTLIFPDGKNYIVREGCKPMKALAKIATAFNLPYFEDFRICHSLVHNQKKITGDITLSIHPLDYWTMSDNESGWDSCMNWRDYGGYRQGTVEMMNSPCVIVAYLSAAEPMSIGNVGDWNSKKWRQLFIVDKNVILGVKAYPYYNDGLTTTIIKWIKELAKENMGWEYLTEEPERWEREKAFLNPAYESEGKFQFGFYSNHMYTDVGCLSWHPIYVGKDLHPSVIPNPIRHYSCEYPLYDFNYSGAAQCVSCGQLDPDLCDDSYLCCPDCEQSCRCSECGERISRDEGYRIGDSYLCEYCWEEHTQSCSLCEDNDFTDNFITVNIMPKLDTEELKALAEEEWVANGCESLANYPETISYELALPTWDIDMCHACFDGFVENYFKDPNGKLFTYQTRYGGLHYGCYLDDLNDDGIEALLGWRVQDDIESGMSKEDLVKKYCLDYVTKINIFNKYEDELPF